MTSSGVDQTPGREGGAGEKGVKSAVEASKRCKPKKKKWKLNFNSPLVRP